MRTLWSLALVCVIAAGCAAPLDIVHGLDEYEANQILVVLSRQGIGAVKQKEEGRVITWAIVVNTPDADRALELLVLNRLPKSRPIGLAEVYPAGGGGLIPTKSEEKAKFIMAMQGEIERKLKSLPGVLQAHVSIVQPDRDIIRDLDKAPPPSTASVAIVYNADKDGSAPITDKEVKALVATSVEELKQENVEVLLKANAPMTILSLDDVKDGPGVEMTGETVLGIQVANKKAGSKVVVTVGLFAVVAVIAILVALGSIVNAARKGAKLSKAEAEVASLKKARRDVVPA